MLIHLITAMFTGAVVLDLYTGSCSVPVIAEDLSGG